MDRHALTQSWATTTRHLKAARDQLLHADYESAVEQYIGQFDECLSCNEFELAFDELDAIGHDLDCGPAFWQELLAAAENMGLARHAARCRLKCRELGDNSS